MEPIICLLPSHQFHPGREVCLMKIQSLPTYLLGTAISSKLGRADQLYTLYYGIKTRENYSEVIMFCALTENGSFKEEVEGIYQNILNL